MTLVRVRLRDARSHRDTALDFSPRVNAIVGESDSGKSNIVRAIRAAVYNESVGASVRDGAKGSYVRLRFDDADIVARKGPKTNAYRVDGLDYTRVGRTPLPEVLAASRMGPVSYGDEEVDIHFAMQRDPAFGVDTRASLLARVVGSVCGIDRVLRASKAASTDATRLAAEVRFATKSADEARSSLAAFDERFDLDRSRAAIDGAVALLAKADAIAARADAVRSIADELREVSASPLLSLDIARFEAAVAVYDESAARADRIERRAREVSAIAREVRSLVRETPSIIPGVRVCPKCRRPL